MKIKLLAFVSCLLLCGLAAFADQYPKIDISGFKKWEYKDVSVDPKTNYFLGLTHLGGYSPNLSGSPWQERLQLKIGGELNEKLKVTYDVEQQPDSPDKYDVKVSYDNKHELTFGDFNASFTGNEFASTTKFLNGVMLTSKDTNYNFILVPSAKLKSQIQGVTTQKGNNLKGPYSLGHGSIIEGTEHIELNGVLQVRGTDYTIDYFEGKVTFNRVLTPLDEIKYSYEYTNIIDLFFPTLSKKDFFGAQGRITLDPSTIGVKTPVPQPKTSEFEQDFPAPVPTAETKTGTPEAAQMLSEDIIAEEAAGKYRLKNIPVVPFSENLVFKGINLRKNEDYIIKYDEGIVTLLTPILPKKDDALRITYKNYSISVITDKLSTNGGKGPYLLTQKNIVLKSESVTLDGRPCVRDLDYTLDYGAGKITFNYNVSSTSLVNIVYSAQEMVLPPPPPPPKYPKSLTLGATYLKESAKKSTTSYNLAYTESRKGSDIINRDNHIYLLKFPVLTSSEGGTVTVRINNVAATQDVDYAIPTVEVDPQTGYARVIPQATLAYITDRSDTSNGYDTGTIKILSTLEATAEVTVMYTYKKSIAARYSAVGNGSRGPYYVRTYRNMVPGSERVEVWTTGSQITDVYTRNSSYEGDAGDKGYSINYTKDNPSITFNKELDPAKNFTVTFQYIAPQAADTTGNISQDLTGVDAAFKLADLLQFDGNYARSVNDQVVAYESSSESYSNFPPTSNKVTLKNTPLIENSEKVYVNNYLRNKDIDYFIDYTGGSITFYSITLSTADVVSVDYQYQSSSGSSALEKEKSDNAYKYGIKSKLGKISAAYNKKDIGFNFSPLGGTAIGIGSNYQDFTLNVDPLPHDLTGKFSYRENNDPIGASRSAFTRKYVRDYVVSVDPFNMADMGIDYFNQEIRGDPASSGAAASADNSQNWYTVFLNPKTFQKGKLAFNQKYDAARRLNEDHVARSKENVKSGHINYGLSFTDRFKASADYQLLEPLTTSTATGGAVSAWSLSRDLGYDISLDLTFPRIQKFVTYAKLLRHEYLVFLPTASKLETKNTTYHVDLTPVAVVAASYDYNRQETPSVVIENKNPMTERTATNVRLTPHPAIGLAWMYSNDHTIHETAKESLGDSDTYNADWTPIAREKIKFNMRFNLFRRNYLAPQGTFEAKTDTNTFNQDYTLTFNPWTVFSLTPGFGQEDYYNFVSTTAAPLRSRNQVTKCNLSYKPIDKLSFDGDYNLKVTTSLADNINRHKSLESARAGFKPFSWGELIYLLEEEHNEGEIQAGGVLPDLNYLKTTNSLSLNFNIPQDNPILSSILFIAALKQTYFENRLRPADNLFAKMMTFEGTLNF